MVRLLLRLAVGLLSFAALALAGAADFPPNVCC